jgi:hypothetical protein
VEPLPLSRLRDALRVGALCLALGVVGWAWALLARQAPSSPWHVAGFPDAVERFALRAWIEGLAVFALAPRAWERRFASAPGRARVLLAALVAGTALALGALAVSAATGLLGTQIRDASGASHGLLVARLAGDALLLVALVMGTRAAMEEG